MRQCLGAPHTSKNRDSPLVTAPSPLRHRFLTTPRTAPCTALKTNPRGRHERIFDAVRRRVDALGSAKWGGLRVRQKFPVQVPRAVVKRGQPRMQRRFVRL
jgi:hypothetical protein